MKKQYNRIQLLKGLHNGKALPQRDAYATTCYEFVLIVQSPELHDSGFNYLTIIGIYQGGQLELVGKCDKIEFSKSLSILSMDCVAVGITRFWAEEKNNFLRVGACFSTTKIDVKTI